MFGLGRYGDSAGAAVATYVAALVCNPRLLRDFQAAVKKHIVLMEQSKTPMPFSLDEYEEVLQENVSGPVFCLEYESEITATALCN